MKRLTNEQKLRKIISTLHTIEVALLVERIMVISDITKADIAENPEGYNTIVTSGRMYLEMFRQVDEILNK